MTKKQGEMTDWIGGNEDSKESVKCRHTKSMLLICALWIKFPEVGMVQNQQYRTRLMTKRLQSQPLG